MITVNVNDWNDNYVEIPLPTLIAWKGALRLEAVGMRHSRGSVATIVRKKLSAPSTVSTAYLARYIRDVVAATLAQLGAS